MSTHVTNDFLCASVGIGEPCGGMCLFERFFATRFHNAGFFSASVPDIPLVNLTPPGATLSEWHDTQYLSTIGATSAAKLGTLAGAGFFCALIFWGKRTDAPKSASPTERLNQCLCIALNLFYWLFLQLDSTKLQKVLLNRTTLSSSFVT